MEVVKPQERSEFAGAGARTDSKVGEAKDAFNQKMIGNNRLSVRVGELEIGNSVAV